MNGFGRQGSLSLSRYGLWERQGVTISTQKYAVSIALDEYVFKMGLDVQNNQLGAEIESFPPRVENFPFF